MKENDRVAHFFKNTPHFKEELNTLREIILSTGLKETFKWGFPVYTYDSKNIAGIGAFKNYFGFWFFQGAMLSDPLKILVNAQKGKTKAMRQLRLTDMESIDKNTLKTIYFRGNREPKKRKGYSL